MSDANLQLDLPTLKDEHLIQADNNSGKRSGIDWPKNKSERKELIQRTIGGREHLLQLEIAGPTALWTRLDSGSCPRSYPAPTFSAAKGIFEMVWFCPMTYVKPVRAEICAPIQYHRYTTNYGGPLRKSEQIKAGTSFQLHAEVLIDVVYRLYAKIESIGPHRLEAAESKYRRQFNRILKRGTFSHVPFLGWKEFMTSYVGPFRESTSVCETENHLIPVMLNTVFDQPHCGAVNPTVRRNVVIDKGVLNYD